MKATSFVLALGLAATGATSGPAEDVPVTLGEALALAEKANPDLQAASARVEAQMARTESVRRMRWPRVGVGVDWSRMDLPAGVFASKLNSGQFTAADFDVARINDPGALNHLGTNLSLELPLDVFGKVGTRASAMAAQGDAAAAATRDATQELRMRVIEAYRQADLAARSVEVTERVLAVAKARESEIEARVDTGGALKADLLRARARRREREADVAERRSQQQVALAGLARLLGRATKRRGPSGRCASGRPWRRHAAGPMPPPQRRRARRAACSPTWASTARSGTTGSTSTRGTSRGWWGSG